MANASGAASEVIHQGGLDSTRSGMTYAIAPRGQDLFLTSHRSGHPEEAEESRLSYFLGSGHLGTTYLYSIADYLFESPIAWYARSQNFDMKPGTADASSPISALPIQSNCLRCHMSSVRPSDPGTINRYAGLPFLHSGITCEACHGDSDRHVRSKGKDPIVDPARLESWLRDSVCLSCHLEGDISVERAGRSALNYRPGEPISDYLAFYVWKDATATARGVSEVEQLAQSTCKRVSGDRMACTSCHDPHLTPDANQRVAFFRAKCLACHSQAEFKTHHAGNQDCTSCHMPRTASANILHVAWTDHRILRQPDSISLKPVTEASGSLTPVFSPGANARDLAMANYLALLDGNRSLETLVWQQLSALRSQAGKDKEFLNAFGTIAGIRGETAQAEQAFREALQIDSNDLTALSDLGTLLARSGRIADAEAVLKRAFDRNEDVVGLAMNFAKAECKAGDREAARTALNKALEFNPHLDRLRDLANQMSDCRVPTAP
jgi:predicted CXXCH cytochrome family protein